MAKDPVCGMDVDEKSARFTLRYHGKMYYFCSHECKQEFEEDPEKYVGQMDAHQT